MNAIKEDELSTVDNEGVIGSKELLEKNRKKVKEALEEIFTCEKFQDYLNKNNKNKERLKKYRDDILEGIDDKDLIDVEDIDFAQTALDYLKSNNPRAKIIIRILEEIVGENEDLLSEGETKKTKKTNEIDEEAVARNIKNWQEKKKREDDFYKKYGKNTIYEKCDKKGKVTDRFFLIGLDAKESDKEDRVGIRFKQGDKIIRVGLKRFKDFLEEGFKVKEKTNKEDLDKKREMEKFQKAQKEEAQKREAEMNVDFEKMEKEGKNQKELVDKSKKEQLQSDIDRYKELIRKSLGELKAKFDEFLDKELKKNPENTETRKKFFQRMTNYEHEVEELLKEKNNNKKVYDDLKNLHAKIGQDLRIDWSVDKIKGVSQDAGPEEEKENLDKSVEASIEASTPAEEDDKEDVEESETKLSKKEKKILEGAENVTIKFIEKQKGKFNWDDFPKKRISQMLEIQAVKFLMGNFKEYELFVGKEEKTAELIVGKVKDKF